MHKTAEAVKTGFVAITKGKGLADKDGGKTGVTLKIAYGNKHTRHEHTGGNTHKVAKDISGLELIKEEKGNTDQCGNDHKKIVALHLLPEKQRREHHDEDRAGKLKHDGICRRCQLICNAEQSICHGQAYRSQYNIFIKLDF